MANKKIVADPLTVEPIYKRYSKGQSAFEYFITYAWALVIAMFALAIVYAFLIAPQAIIPNSCSFISGAYCQDMVLGSNSVSSKVALFLTNTQQYPILNPQISINISNVGAVSGNCLPSYVLPGGAIICNVTLPTKTISTGTLVSGKLYLSATPCPSGNATACSSSQKETYVGTFNSHAEPLLTNTTATISISVLNSTEANNIPDPVTATVELLGKPLAGATVSFTLTNPNTNTPVSYVSAKPTIGTTDANGRATSLVTSSISGPVKVTASFAGISANVIINFVMPVYVTFETSPQISATQPILTLDNINYLPSQLPITVSWSPGSKHNYNFLNINENNVLYKFSSITGCGLTKKAGIINTTKNCTVIANYEEKIEITSTTTTTTTPSSTTVTTTILPPGWHYYVQCIPPPPPTTEGSTICTAPRTISPCAYPQPTNLGGSLLDSYTVTPPGAYNNLNTYYYFNQTYKIENIIQTKRNYTFTITDDNSGSAAWFNFPIWFTIGSNINSSVGAVILFDPCVGSAKFGILQGGTGLGTVGLYNNQSQLVNMTTGPYPVLVANYTSTSNIAGSTITVKIYYQDKSHAVIYIPTLDESYNVTLLEPIDKNNMYFTVGYAYDQGFGGYGSNGYGVPEGTVNVISSLTLVPVNNTQYH